MTKRDHESTFSDKTSVHSRETRGQRLKKQKIEKKKYTDPFKCWDDKDFPQNHVTFKQERNCPEAGKPHVSGGSCYDFDDFVGEMTHPTFRDKALLEPYYEVNIPSKSDIVYATFYIQRTYANIDILKKRLTEKEKKILSRPNITKANNLKDILVAKEKKKRKEKRKQVRLPIGFSEWPDVFKYINERDDKTTKDKKRRALRDCLNRRIDFMNDCVYDCGDISQTWINAHLDFIIILQILAAKNNA